MLCHLCSIMFKDCCLKMWFTSHKTLILSHFRNAFLYSENRVLFFFLQLFCWSKNPVVISRTYPWSLNRIANGVYFNLYLFSTIWEHLAQYSTTTGMPHLFWCNDVLPDVHWRAALSLVLWHWRTNWSYWTAR